MSTRPQHYRKHNLRSTDTTVESGEWDGLTVTQHVAQEELSTTKRQLADGLSSFAGVLEVNADVRSSGLAS
jgi:hypothetical protein